MPKKAKDKFYQYIVHCCFVFDKPYNSSELEQTEIDKYLVELQNVITEKLQWNYQVENLELVEVDGINTDVSTEDRITCSFDFQNAFIRSELEEDGEGHEGALSPTDEALTALESEFQPILSIFKPLNFQFISDFDNFIN